MSLKSSARGPEGCVEEQKCPGFLWEKGATLQSQPASRSPTPPASDESRPESGQESVLGALG